MPPLQPPLPDDFAELCRERFGITDLPPEGPVVPRDQLVALATALKDELGYRFFVYCAASHHPKESQCQVAWRVRRLGKGTVSAPFRVIVPDGETCPTLSGVYAGADWQEREQYDLVGVVFDGHPDLRRLMLPEDWEGHPLRKDYAIDTHQFPWR